MSVRTEFVIKDSGKRQEFESGMVRDVDSGKKQYHRVLEGPMFVRWAEHLTKGSVKYADSPDGTANWTKASGEAELRRFKQSAIRHFIDWYNGAVDEDHAAAIFFNVNGAEYVKDRLVRESTGKVEKEFNTPLTVAKTMPILPSREIGGSSPVLCS